MDASITRTGVKWIETIEGQIKRFSSCQQDAENVLSSPQPPWLCTSTQFFHPNRPFLSNTTGSCNFGSWSHCFLHWTWVIRSAFSFTFLSFLLFISWCNLSYKIRLRHLSEAVCMFSFKKCILRGKLCSFPLFTTQREHYWEAVNQCLK